MVENKRDSLGKYTKITYLDGRVFIERFFREIGLSVRIQQNLKTN